MYWCMQVGYVRQLRFLRPGEQLHSALPLPLMHVLHLTPALSLCEVPAVKACLLASWLSTVAPCGVDLLGLLRFLAWLCRPL